MNTQTGKPTASSPPQPLTAKQRAAVDLVQTLPSLSKQQLLALWPGLFDVPPFSDDRNVLIGCMVYRTHEMAFGRLPQSVRRKLDAIAAELEAGNVPELKPDPRIRPGTRILRGWKGRVYEVLVVDKGYLYRRQIYAELDPIARWITHGQYSALQFFGVKGSSNETLSRRIGIEF